MSYITTTTEALASGATFYGAIKLARYAVQNPSCTWLAPSVIRGASNEPFIALTFDDGPSEASYDICPYSRGTGSVQPSFSVARMSGAFPRYQERCALPDTR